LFDQPYFTLIEGVEKSERTDKADTTDAEQATV
jgi:hypothetical protein